MAISEIQGIPTTTRWREPQIVDGELGTFLSYRLRNGKISVDRKEPRHSTLTFVTAKSLEASLG